MSNEVFFRGVATALVTPMMEDQSVDEAALRELVEFQIANGVDALVPCGTTGESATLTHEEHRRVMSVVVEQTAHRVPVIAGAGSNATAEAVSLTHHARKIGADAVLSVAPYYNKPTQRGFLEHYRAIARAAEIPVIIYNVPGRTGSNIDAATTLALAEIPGIAGVKEASGNVSQIMDILHRRPEGFGVYSGDDALAYPLLALGADGVISVVSNEVPAEFCTMVHACLDGNFDDAREMHYRLLRLMNLNFVESNPIPVKAALAMMGKITESYRLPLTPMAERNKEQLRAVLSELCSVEAM